MTSGALFFSVGRHGRRSFAGRFSFYRNIKQMWRQLNKSHRELFPDDLEGSALRPPLVVPPSDPDDTVGLRCGWDFRQ